MRRLLMAALLVVGVGALAVAGATVLEGRRSGASGLERPPLALAGPGGAFEPPAVLRSGEPYDFPVEVRNDGDEPARLLGALEYCGGSCYAVRGLPLTVPAGGRAVVTLHIEARVPGTLADDITIYTDRPEQPTFVFPVHGVILEAEPDASAPDGAAAAQASAS